MCVVYNARVCFPRLFRKGKLIQCEECLKNGGDWMTSQEKKQYLSQYLYICDEIEDLLRDLEEWYTIAGKVTASYSGTPGGGSSDKLSSVVAKILEIKDSCAERLERMESLKHNVEQAVSSVDEIELRRILRRRYIRGWDFQKIADNLNYSYRQITRLHGIALRKVDENLLI